MNQILKEMEVCADFLLGIASQSTIRHGELKRKGIRFDTSNLTPDGRVYVYFSPPASMAFIWYFKNPQKDDPIMSAEMASMLLDVLKEAVIGFMPGGEEGYAKLVQSGGKECAEVDVDSLCGSLSVY
jgi:hypothetical protein